MTPRERERQLRAAGYSRKQAMAIVAQEKRKAKPQPGRIAAWLRRLTGKDQSS